MGYKLRRLLGSGTQDTAAVLSTAQTWELLRAAYFQRLNRPVLAAECWDLASNYEFELQTHLDRINKGETP